MNEIDFFQGPKIVDCKGFIERIVTEYEKQLHGDVTAFSAVTDERVVVAALVVTGKADVVRHGDSHVEGRQQNEPIPQGLGDAVVQQDETGLLHGRNLVLR